MSVREDRFRELCAARALGHLSEEERWELDRLLADADPDELRACEELERVALHLPAAVNWVDPPPRVKARLMAVVREEREAVSVRRTPVRWARSRLAQWLGWLHPRRALLAATLALTLVAIGLGVHAARLEQALERTENLLGILQSPDVEMVKLDGLEPQPDSRGTLLWDSPTQTAILKVSDLAPAPTHREYQLWIYFHDRSLEPLSLGTFTVAGSERNAVFRFAGFPAFDRASIRGILVTEEPEGGNAAPGGSWILGARVGFE